MKIAHSLDIKSLRVFEAVASMDNLVRSQLYKESILIVVPKDKAQRARHNDFQGWTWPNARRKCHLSAFRHDRTCRKKAGAER